MNSRIKNEFKKGKPFIRYLINLINLTFKAWSDDEAQRLAAALAYYTIFSIAPLLLISIAVAGFFWGHDAAQNEIAYQIQGLVGKEGADTIQSMIQNSRKPSTNILVTLIGIITLLFGASGVFGELQTALNTIWDVKPKPGKGIATYIKNRFLSFSMVLGIGFLLLVSLVLSAALAAFGHWLIGLSQALNIMLQIITLLISFGITTLLFALIFKILPDTRIKWSDVWVGAIVTSLLFSLGRFLIGLYLGHSGISSTYGAAGSLVIILIWIYYSTQILFLGAEFTHVYATEHGSQKTL